MAGKERREHKDEFDYGALRCGARDGLRHPRVSWAWIPGKVYENALAQRLAKRDIAVQQQYPLTVYDDQLLLTAVGSGLKKLVGLVSTADVDRRKPRLTQNAGGQVSPLAHLAVDGDFPIAGQFVQTGSQFIHGDVHGAGNISGRKLLGRSHVEDERTLGRPAAATTAAMSACGWSPRSNPAATKPAMLIGSLAEPYCGA